MSFDSFHVYFSGEVIKGQDPEQVKQKIGELFKLEGEKLERLFSGQPIAIKKDIDMEHAAKFRVLFREAGALVDIKPADAPPPNSSLQPPPAEIGPVENDAFTLSNPNEFDLSDCTPQITAQPISDISRLSLGKPGSIIDENQPPPTLEIDTSELAMDQNYDKLDQSAPVEPPHLDTSDLTLAPEKTGSLEAFHQPVESPSIPTDHLQLEPKEQKSNGKVKFDLPD